ncbi:putative methyltransferase DDB_G0268948 [Lingula anatina]|uniref:Methyltransferase DDB_G0268948 n=1 Tax=Lingula anatina TaxID=7574 RepID=A0A1S3KCS8_LINAN|nr:putative methyltransferase DDB_G0268948 [Lingula anatina]|eukprot:XP_013420297.1 putative methyltransferase DDB_G0268948 [Lingula anatina]
MAFRLYEGADHTSVYAKYRSVWTTDITDRVLTYLQEKFPAPYMYDHAIDVGCGSGQFTHLLAPHFKQVTGIDISANQISAAIKGNDKKNITYKVGSGECFSIADQSVELVTCVQAAHWIDMDKFYAEAYRVLKPNGCVALISFTFPEFGAHPQAKLLTKPLGNYYDKLWETSCPAEMINRLKHVYNRYPDEIFACRPPLEDHLRDETMTIVHDMTVEQVVGFASSSSGYVKYVKKYSSSDILETLQKNILKTLGEDATLDTVVRVTFPVFILFGRKPG